MIHPEIALLFFLIAAVYASAGFGGGSSYLAVLALYDLPYQDMRLTALLCNIVVVLGGTMIYLRKRQMNLKKTLPLVYAGVPLAFAGAVFKIREQTFFIVLGISLILASLLLIRANTVVQESPEAESKPANGVRDGILGGAIGFLSGMVGIGGGIFLSPLLNLMNWDNPKKIAAAASFFILVNSLSGIAGQFVHFAAHMAWTRVLILAMSVLAGGQVGSRLSVLKLNQLAIRRITAVVVFVAGMEVLHKYMFHR